MTSAPAEKIGSERLPLTQERILQAAVDLVDEHGIDALSMRRLGSVLGVEAMSIYNHIPNKATLLRQLVNKIIALIEIPPQEDDWEERLKKMSRNYRALAQAHPHFVELIATTPYGASLPALRQVEAIFEILKAGGFHQSQWMDIVRTFSTFAIGFTMSEVSGFLGESDESSQEDIDYGAVMHEFPLMVEMLPHMGELDHNAQFEFGLEVFISGLKAKLG
ncbi:MAG TPA: TetR/AcrR family transcriptional regulator [Actinomycetota bacterium]|nr:TetR/AcrR family transcriptional regulator [Actinomycetota bacterium]